MSDRSSGAGLRLRKRSDGPTSQRGVAAIVLAGVLVFLVPLLALAIETGRVYYAQRQLEKLATIAAMDAVRVASGCASAANGAPGDGVQAPLAATSAEVAASIARNNQTLLSLQPSPSVPQVEVGKIQQSADGKKRSFFAQPEGTPTNDAVRVNLVSAMPPTLFLAYFTRGTALYASATAQQAPRGVFHVGSDVLNLSGGMVNNLLGTLLCAPNDSSCINRIVSLDVANARAGLAQVNVSLGQLATAAGVTVQDLSNPLALSTKTPVLSDFLNGLAGQLSGTVSGTVSGLLRDLAGASTNPSGIPLGQLLGTVDGIAGSVPFVNLYDLILQLGQAATAGDPPGTVRPIILTPSVDIPGVATVGVFLQVLDPPRIASGQPGTSQAVAQTAQVLLQVRISAGALVTTLINTIKGVLGLVGLTNVTSVSNIGIDVAVAPARASLNRLQCPVPTINQGMPVAGLSVTTGVATVEIGTFSGAANSGSPITPAGSIPLLTGDLTAPLGLGSAKLAIALDTSTIGVGVTNHTLQDVTQWSRLTTDDTGQPLPPSAAAIHIADGSYDAPAPDNPQTFSSSAQLSVAVNLHQPIVSNCTNVLFCAVGGLLNTVVSLVTPLVNTLVGLINGITAAVVQPLLDALGIHVGSATVIVNSAVISQPNMVSTCLPGSTRAGC